MVDAYDSVGRVKNDGTRGGGAIAWISGFQRGVQRYLRVLWALTSGSTAYLGPTETKGNCLLLSQFS